MNTLTNSSGTWDYLYRADGMRVSKSNGSASTLYRYDGQMAMEDVDTGTNPAVTDYAIGARGIDAISKTSGGNTVVVYPIYDAHGNMMADVSKTTGGGFSINDKRSYDAWGNIRSGASTGDPKGRYCANLGHVQDDESNLVYMRARYYDPTSGRFISEDSNRQSLNWFAYAQNQPTDRVDASGKDDMWEILSLAGNVMLAIGQIMMGGYPTSASDISSMICVQIGDFVHGWKMKGWTDGFWPVIDALKAMIDLGNLAKDAGYVDGKLAGQAYTALAGYMMCIEGAILLCDSDMESGGQGENWGFDPGTLITGGN